MLVYTIVGLSAGVFLHTKIMENQDSDVDILNYLYYRQKVLFGF